MSDLTNLLGRGYTRSDVMRARGTVIHKGEALWLEERINELVTEDGADEVEAQEQAEHELSLISQAT